MTPDRMRGWLKKVPHGAVSLEICIDEPASGLIQIATWEASEIDEMKGSEDGDVADALIATAQEQVEGEESRQKFVIRWHGKRGKVLKTTTHWANPPAPESESDAGGGGGNLSDKIVRDILVWSAKKDQVVLNAMKVSGEAYRTSAEAYEKTIHMLQRRLETANQSITEHEKTEPSSLPTVVFPEPTEIEEAEIMQRTKALEALTSKIPDMLDLAITTIANKLLENEPGAAGANAADAARAAAAAANGGGH